MFQTAKNWNWRHRLSGDSADEEKDKNNENGSIFDESILAGNLIDKDEVEIKDEDFNDLSDEDDDDWYTSISCTKTLAKFSPSSFFIASQLITYLKFVNIFPSNFQEAEQLTKFQGPLHQDLQRSRMRKAA